MPTGQTPQPQYKRGKDLAYGDAASANDLLAALGPQPDQGQQDYQPQGEAEQFLFGPTNRPAEPITAGAPFGPGPSVSRAKFPTEAQAIGAVAEQIRQNPNVSKEARAWAARVQAGE